MYAHDTGIHRDRDEAGWNELAPLNGEGSPAFGSGRERTTLPDEELGADSAAALYISEIGRTPLLTAAEEVQLAQEREAGRAAAARLAAGVDDAATAAQLEASVRVGKLAEQRLIEANLRLVVSIARKYLGRGLSFLDLVQEGNIGLQRGVAKYDWRRGFRFSTYAYWWIRQAVSRAVAEQGRAIRLPVHLIEQLGKLHTIARTLQIELGREPTTEEIAGRAGLEPARVRDALLAARVPLSLDTPFGEDADTTMADLVADPDLPPPGEQVEAEILADELLATLGQLLTTREFQVMRLRFGLRGEHPRTLKEVGSELGVSRERARQLEVEALRKLHRAAPRLRRFQAQAE